MGVGRRHLVLIISHHMLMADSDVSHRPSWGEREEEERQRSGRELEREKERESECVCVCEREKMFS